MNKKIFLLTLFLLIPGSVFGIVGLQVSITPAGVISPFSLPCSGTNATALLLYGSYPYQYSVHDYMRRPCIGGSVNFDSFDLNAYLVAQTGTSTSALWSQHYHLPFALVIKDTTTLFSATPTFTDLINLISDQNRFNTIVEDPGDSTYPTLGVGTSFDFDGAVWSASSSPVMAKHDSILFLPGFEGSRLYQGDSRLWEPLGDADVRSLFLESSGKPPAGQNIVAKDVIDEAYSPLGPNVYKTFLANISNLKSAGDIADYSAVPYDWRLSFDDILSGSNIMSELSRLASSSQTGKVTIVAHSNGGLVAKALIQKLQNNHDPLLAAVDKLILVAVPQIGTPEAIASLLHGYKTGIPASWFAVLLSESAARQFGNTMPGAYALLPSEKYFSVVDTPVVSSDSSTILSKSGLDQFLTDTAGRVAIDSGNLSAPVSLNSGLLTQADAAHDILDTWTAPDSLHVAQIAGWGMSDTLSGIDYVPGRCLALSCGTLFASIIKPEPRWTVDGDGTVVIPSALYLGGNAARYYVDLKSYNSLANQILNLRLTRKHFNILEIKGLNDFIDDIVDDKDLSVLPSYISSSYPMPTGGDSQLIYSLQSELSLNLYDTSGNHTGVSTTTSQIEENIPNTYIRKFGDTTYIFTASSTKVKVIISGDKSTPKTPAPVSFKVEKVTTKPGVIAGNQIIASTTVIDDHADSHAKLVISVDDISSTSPMEIFSEDSQVATVTPILDETVSVPDSSDQNPDIVPAIPPPPPEGNGPPPPSSPTIPEIISSPVTPVVPDVQPSPSSTPTLPKVIQISFSISEEYAVKGNLGVFVRVSKKKSPNKKRKNNIVQANTVPLQAASPVTAPAYSLRGLFDYAFHILKNYLKK